jgi:hypothetical protein
MRHRKEAGVPTRTAWTAIGPLPTMIQHNHVQDNGDGSCSVSVRSLTRACALTWLPTTHVMPSTCTPTTRLPTHPDNLLLVRGSSSGDVIDSSVGSNYLEVAEYDLRNNIFGPSRSSAILRIVASDSGGHHRRCRAGGAREMTRGSTRSASRAPARSATATAVVPPRERCRWPTLAEPCGRYCCSR